MSALPKSLRSELFWLALFSTSMGLMEAVIVAYLRELYHPRGFQFPLQPVPDNILFAEILREACTIVMIVSVAALGGGSGMRRFGRFLIVFGAWDIIYYIGLKLLLDWPPSLLTWDILFLIPITWVGPVLAPVIAALTMIALGLIIMHQDAVRGPVRPGRRFWIALFGGALLILTTFLWEHSRLNISNGLLSGPRDVEVGASLQQSVSEHIPGSFNWWLFALGEALLLVAAVVYSRRGRAQSDGR